MQFIQQRLPDYQLFAPVTPMEATARPGADLLWAFQLHREHRALSKRLTAVETSTSKQKERLTVAEQSVHSDQHERVDALTQRLRKLEDAEVTEQVAGLASELRTTRQQLGQACDKMKVIEKASKEFDSKASDKGRDVQDKLGEFASVVAQTQNAVHSLEGRLEIAVDSAGRFATKAVTASSERYEQQIGALSEEIRSLEQAHGDLRASIESDRRDRVVAPVFSVSTHPKAPEIAETGTTLSMPSHNSDRIEQMRSGKQAICKSPAQEQTAIDVPVQQHSSNIIAPAAQTLGSAEEKKPSVSGKSKRKRGFTKEITQLIHGDGSLTNAPQNLDSQEPGLTTRGNKRLKAGATEGRSLRSALPKPGLPANKIKEEPTATRAKAKAQPAKAAATASHSVAKITTARPAPKSTTTKNKGRKGRTKPKEAPVPRNPLPTSEEIQVFHTPSMSRLPPVAPTLAGSPLRLKLERNTAIQQEQRRQQRRRRIQQDDSMEEFLAKCEAATEI
jgi:hypothetical protein